MADRVLQRPDGTVEACNVNRLWDEWIGCIINSECFRGSEGKMGARPALKACAQRSQAEPSSPCGKLHERWSMCKLQVSACCRFIHRAVSGCRSIHNHSCILMHPLNLILLLAAGCRLSSASLTSRRRF
jgi:hypothetical protein